MRIGHLLRSTRQLMLSKAKGEGSVLSTRRPNVYDSIYSRRGGTKVAKGAVSLRSISDLL